MSRYFHPMTSANSQTIGIIGSGSVGSALAQGLTRAGHSVVIGVREPATGNERDLATTARTADVIILAVPYGAIDDVIASIGDCAGKVVIDCTNPLGKVGGLLALTCGFDTSAGEQLAAKLPSAYVVKTLNQTGAENMADAGRFEKSPMMFVAGDDADAVATACALVADLGFEPVHAGPLAISRLLEPLAMLWIDQALVRGAGRDFAFARIHPQKAQ